MTRTAVYRHYDAEGRLLYVGAARSFGNRTQTHMREAQWASQSARAEATFYPTREEALDAEMIAIQTEAPIYNSVRNGRSLSKPPKRQKRSIDGPVGGQINRRQFALLWAEYLKTTYGTAYAVQKAFPGIDSKTARDWISGKRDPSGSFVAVAVSRDPNAIKILGAVA